MEFSKELSADYCEHILQQVLDRQEYQRRNNLVNKDTLNLEQITDRNTKLVKSKIELYANDDGKVYLSLPTATHELMYNEVIKFSDMNFLYCFVDKNSKSKVLFPLKDSQVDKVEDFFNYWTDKRLLELKQAKWNSFCEYWQIVFKFVEDNIDLANNKVTYEYHSSHHSDDLNYFDIHLGEGCFGSREDMGIEYYNPYFELNKELEGVLIDRYLDDDEGVQWFSGIHVQFKP